MICAAFPFFCCFCLLCLVPGCPISPNPVPMFGGFFFFFGATVLQAGHRLDFLAFLGRRWQYRQSQRQTARCKPQKLRRCARGRGTKESKNRPSSASGRLRTPGGTPGPSLHGRCLASAWRRRWRCPHIATIILDVQNCYILRTYIFQYIYGVLTQRIE